MAIDQSAGAAPIFLGPPLVTTDADTAGDIVCSDSAMQALRNRLYQLDPTAPCASVGSSGTETIIMGFWVGSSQQSQSFDCVFILNMNLVRFKIEYSADNGNNYTAVPGADYSGADYSGTDFVLFLTSPLAANKLKLTMYDVTNKSLCVFDCALTTFQSSRPLEPNFNPRQLMTRKDILLADGTKDQTYFEWSDNSFTLVECDCELNLVSAALKASFDSVFASTSPFLFYPEPGDVKRGIFLSTLKLNSYQQKYISSWKGNGFKINFTTEALGYV